MAEICKTCPNKSGCEATCAALDQLYRICEEQDASDKTVRIRTLARQLGIRDAEPSKKLKVLGNKLIRNLPELAFIREWNIKIGYVESNERKGGEKIIFADCRKVQEVFRAYLPFDFIITFYNRNTGMLSDNQLQVLMFHELRHIALGDRGFKVRPHDVEDFAEILEKYGLDWNQPGKEIPDILGGD